jgi:hypothetical protein
LIDIFTNLRRCHLQSNNLKILIFVRENWPNDLINDYKPPSNSLEMIEKGFRFWSWVKGIWSLLGTRRTCGHIKCWKNLFPLTQLVLIYLWRKVVFLFCFVPLRPTELGCFRLCSWSLWKALKERGAWAWFHGIWTCSVEVLHYW